ncbi:MAG: FecR domain-containing protein [Bacteroidota bacterium]
MNANDTYYPDLITRYLSGEASQEEITELSAWVQTDPANAILFDELRKTWFGVMADQVEQQADLDKEWESFVPNIRHPVSGDFQSESGREPKVIQMVSSKPSWQVRLIRASLIAAIALVLLIPSWFAYHYFTRTKVVTVTATSEILDAILPDGSMISLNAHASLAYAEDFGKKHRNIELNGEGYFEVNMDSLLPFVISCGNSRVEVLGTSFYVDARQAAGNMEVILVDGSISVYFDKARSTGKTIIPGEKAELSQTNQRIVVSPNEDPNFLAWKTHHMIFLDDRLDMIINTLNKVYQTDITLANENLASCRLTATFDQQSLESVLNVILVTLDLQAENTPSGIILYGKGCN